MAISYGESCSAENREFGEWEQVPWGDGTDETSEALARIQKQTAIRVESAFRAGFRAGQEQVLLDANREAPAGSPLGVELSKIRDRLNALETHPERLGSSEKHIDRRVEALEKATEAQTLSFDQRLAVLEGRARRKASGEPDAQGYPVHWSVMIEHKIDAIEAKLRLLEPIGMSVGPDGMIGPPR